jgi:hypothetical protein
MGSFDSLALELFAYQYESNAPYRRLCDSVQATPATVSHWSQIPSVPSQAFRAFDLTCVGLDNCSTVFYSSGTTSSQACRHWMTSESLGLYELSLTISFDQKFPNAYPIWAVMPSGDDAPHSSLSHMLQTLRAEQFAGADLQDFRRDLTAKIADETPIILFGTALGLIELLGNGVLPLPDGSIVIETGGFKGRMQEIPRLQFYAMLRAKLNVPDNRCFAEYGMCELASQFYSRGENGALSGPYWAKTRCIDPITDDDVGPSEIGILRHYDLANLNSVGVVQTRDRALMNRDGSFHLLGRAAGADLRGCSLIAEDQWLKR